MKALIFLGILALPTAAIAKPADFDEVRFYKDCLGAGHERQYCDSGAKLLRDFYGNPANDGPGPYISPAEATYNMAVVNAQIDADTAVEQMNRRADTINNNQPYTHDFEYYKAYHNTVRHR